MKELSLGKWILPQPENIATYISIPKLGHYVPFGYKESETEKDWLDPIPLELNALEKAKKHIKQYSLRDVAAWLTTVTGREISHVGLQKRLKDEQSRKRKSTTYRLLAKRYQEALKKAEAFENRLGSTEDDNYFRSEKYRKLRESFTNNDTDSTDSGASECNIQT